MATTTPRFTSATILAAQRDGDLIARIVALGQAQGLAQAEIEGALTRIVSAPVDSDGNTLASGFEYASASYSPTPTPGADTTKVRDDQITAALKAVLGDK